MLLKVLVVLEVLEVLQTYSLMLPSSPAAGTGATGAGIRLQLRKLSALIDGGWSAWSRVCVCECVNVSGGVCA